MQGRFPRFRRHNIRPVDFFLRTTHQPPQQTFSRSFRFLCRLLRFCPTLFFLHMSRRFLGLLLAAGALCVGIAAFFGERSAVDEYDGKQEMLARLEEMYQAGDYETMYHTYYDSEYHGASFRK